jgi:transposase
MQTATTIGLDIATADHPLSGGINAVHLQLKRRYVLAFFEKLPPYAVPLKSSAA